MHISSQSTVIPLTFQRPPRRTQRCTRPRNALQMEAKPRSECLAVALELEDVEEEMPLMDHATRAAEHRVLLALLGFAAGVPPIPATLDLLAKCFDSSARLNPTIDIVPIFPFLLDSLADRMNALGAPQTLLTSEKYEADAKTLVAAVNFGRAQRQAQLPALSLIIQPPPPSLPTASSPSRHSPLADTHARVIGDWDGPLQFKTVAVGGTFDRLHAGHRLLLAATALVAKERIFVGVTSDKLLISKKNKELLESYDFREAAAVEYMRRVNPNVVVTSGPLIDPKIPPIAATQAGFDAIVVSEETIHGAEEINYVRKSLGYKPLVVVVVGLISGATGGGGKLSSTDLRNIAASGGGGSPRKG